jgi:hypothetical protein
MVGSASVSSGGGVRGSEACVIMRDSGFRRRFEMRLNGFSSTFKRRDLWRASAIGNVSFELRGQAGGDWTFFWLTQKAVGRHFGDLIVVLDLKKLTIEDLEGKKTAVVLRGFKCRSCREMKSEAERSGTFDSAFY